MAAGSSVFGNVCEKRLQVMATPLFWDKNDPPGRFFRPHFTARGAVPAADRQQLCEGAASTASQGAQGHGGLWAHTNGGGDAGARKANLRKDIP